MIPYTIRRPFIAISDFPQNVKWFIQRGRRGYSDSDLWGFDDYLLKMLPMALRQFNEKSFAHPVTDTIKTPEDWKSTISQMIEGFEAARDVDENIKLKAGKEDEYHEAWHVVQSKLDHAMQLMSKNFFSLWW